MHKLFFTKYILQNMAYKTKENPFINQTKNNMIRLCAGIRICTITLHTLHTQYRVQSTHYTQSRKLLN